MNDRANRKIDDYITDLLRENIKTQADEPFMGGPDRWTSDESFTAHKFGFPFYVPVNPDPLSFMKITDP